nr:uncharacterized protein LOC100180910 isoform X1 [Ciona intestinalis]|eukprot:XP_018669464.1 uncharacterized protein LOC100180910 isoform X1 [Ciona intestinalis]
MTLLSPHRAFMDYPNSNQDLPLNQCENLEEVFDEITSELSQIEWSGIASNLRINPDKLHLVSLSSGCDLQRQKTLGLLCWVEDERSGATFERLVSALNQVDAKSLSGDVKAFSRLLRMRKASAQRKLEATQYYPLPISPHKNLPKSANGQWKFAELPHFILGSSSSAFFPSRSVPTNPTFDLTSSVSIHGARVNLLERNRWQIKTAKKNSRPATISGKTTQPRRRALGVHKRIGHVRIHTSIKTAVPLTNTPRDCHPEMMQEIIANKLFNYLLNETGSREILSMVSTLESINGLVVKRMTRGSINIETYIHKTTALKALWGHFESGQLNEMLQERLISENSLKMASAFDISLETSIDRAELESCLQQLQGSNRKSTAFNSSDRRATASYYRGSSPPRNKVSFSKYPRVPYSGLQSSSKLRAASVPHSRSINVELAPSIRTVKPEPRSSDWRADKARPPAKGDKLPGVVFAEDALVPPPETAKEDVRTTGNDEEVHSAPPPSPDLEEPGDAPTEMKRSEEEEEEIRLALEDLHKRTHEADNNYRQFNEVALRRFVDSLKNSPNMGIKKIGHVGDLRKYATILRKNDAAEIAQLVEEFVNVTESLDRIHRDVTSKIWLRVADVSTASAKSRDSTGSHRRSPMRNQVSQSIEIWRQMLDPQFRFTELKTDFSDDLKKMFDPEELEEYGGLLSHVPALLTAAKTCHHLLSHYTNAP